MAEVHGTMGSTFLWDCVREMLGCFAVVDATHMFGMRLLVNGGLEFAGRFGDGCWSCVEVAVNLISGPSCTIYYYRPVFLTRF